MKLLGAIFCFGFFLALAQILLVREMLVASYGNELVIGLVFAIWLAFIGVGALTAMTWVERPAVRRLRTIVAVLMVLSALGLPLQVWFIRGVRLWLKIPVGEHAGPGEITLIAILLVAPLCIITGMVVPAVTRITAREQPQPVARVYLVEAVGFAVAGLLFTFGLAGTWNAMRIAGLACTVLSAAAVMVARAGNLRTFIGAVMLAAAVFTAWPPASAEFEHRAAMLRWRAAGMLGARGGDAHLVATRDTRLQNLAAIKNADQTTVFADGEVVFSMPDTHANEHIVHFVMAQRSEARRVLLIGGDPLGIVPELLRYPYLQVVCVQPDAGMPALLLELEPAVWKRVMRDPRVTTVIDDGPRFAASTAMRFDVILVMAPEPLTAAHNRYYTVDFYRSIAAILSPYGFLWTSVASSERLEALTLRRGAAVYHSLRTVFAKVLVTAGERTQYFAAGSPNHLTFDRDELLRRSGWINLETRWFRPEYFRTAEEIDPAKTDWVRAQFDDSDVPVNTVLHPVVLLHSLCVWSRMVDSRIESLLTRAASVNLVQLWRQYRTAGFCFAALCTVVFVGGRWLFGRRRTGGLSWSCWCARVLIGLSGLTTIAFELLIIVMVQSLYGDIFSHIGVIMAVFMMGLAVGAILASMAERATERHMSILLQLQAALLLTMVAVPVYLELVARIDGFRVASPFFFYLVMGIAGLLAGAQFVLVNRLLQRWGDRVGHAVAWSTAFDHFGAAAGAFTAGVLCIPVLGLVGTAATLAGIQIAGMVLLVSMAPGAGDDRR